MVVRAVIHTAIIIMLTVAYIGLTPFLFIINTGILVLYGIQ